MMLSDIVSRGAERFPENVALIFQDTTVTYRELAVAVERLARGLAALGIGPGDSVSLLLPNCPPFVYGYFAASALGATIVPVNPLLKAAELEYIWRDSHARLVVTIPQLLSTVEAARQSLPELAHVVCTAGCEALPDPAIADSIPGFVSAAELMAAGAASDAPLAPCGGRTENECAVVIYTSGTTGRPKGAMLSHRNLIRNVEQVLGALHFTDADRFMTALPLFHAFAATVCMNVCLYQGCASLLLDSFIPGRALEAVRTHGITILPAVPAMFNAILMTTPDRSSLGRVRLFVSGGAPLPVSTLATLEERYGVPVLEGDGPTECSPVTSVNPEHGPRKVGSVGPALPGVEVAIFDDTDSVLPIDTIGEIVVRGDNVMLGYLNQPEATAEAMRGGWYHTGDLGRIDADGYIYILDRKKDMVITSGLNVYPREVEEVLMQHPAVADCAVIGLPDGLRGEAVTAVVVLKQGADASERDLMRFCRDRLANYKTPQSVLFRTTLPRGGTGKVVKRLLKKELEMESESPKA